MNRLLQIALGIVMLLVAVGFVFAALPPTNGPSISWVTLAFAMFSASISVALISIRLRPVALRIFGMFVFVGCSWFLFDQIANPTAGPARPGLSRLWQSVFAFLCFGIPGLLTAIGLIRPRLGLAHLAKQVPDAVLRTPPMALSARGIRRLKPDDVIFIEGHRMSVRQWQEINNVVAKRTTAPSPRGESVRSAVAFVLLLAVMVGGVALRLPMGVTAASVVAVLIGYFLVVHRLFGPDHDRIRRQVMTESGMPVCLECGYNLSGEPEAGCPECGWRREPSTQSPGT